MQCGIIGERGCHEAETSKITSQPQSIGKIRCVSGYGMRFFFSPIHPPAFFYNKEIERHQANNGKAACLNPFCKVIIVSLFDHEVRVIRIHNFSGDIILGKYFCISARPASRGSSMLVLRQCQGCPLQADIAPFVCLFFLSEK